MFAKTVVAGPQANPLFAALAQATGKPPAWNFHKYLVDRQGRPVAAFASRRAATAHVQATAGMNGRNKAYRSCHQAKAARCFSDTKARAAGPVQSAGASRRPTHQPWPGSRSDSRTTSTASS
jgi:Cu/Zn superoxide dismutase